MAKLAHKGLSMSITALEVLRKTDLFLNSLMKICVSQNIQAGWAEMVHFLSLHSQTYFPVVHPASLEQVALG